MVSKAKQQRDLYSFVVMKLFAIVLLLLCIVPLKGLADVPVLEIDSDNVQQPLIGYIEYVFDGTGTQTYDEILAINNWEDVGEKPYSKGLEMGAVWLRFQVKNISDGKKESYHNQYSPVLEN